MDKNIFFLSFAYHHLRKLPFASIFGGKTWRLAAETTKDAFICRLFIFGIPVLTRRELNNLVSIELGKGLPILAIKSNSHKVCGYIGFLEIFKLRYTGVLPLGCRSMPIYFIQRNTKRIFFDVGNVFEKDTKGGITRTARSLFYALKKLLPQGWELCPVYSRQMSFGYYYADKYYYDQTSENNNKLSNKPIEIALGDIFFSAMTDFEATASQKNALLTMKQAGVRLFTIIYDLIPLTHGHYCPQPIVDGYNAWIRVISEFDGVIADSRSVAEEYRQWREKHWQSGDPFSISWFHLGSDVKSSPGSKEIPDSAQQVFAAMAARPSFLEVSTVEPRKGYGQALAAFERLWAKGIDANFIIVGRKGWKIDELAAKIDGHPENGKRLFWLKGISDEYLNEVYEAASCVLFPSEAEGFGLAVVEGARHGKPLILRDIPVFREIAGDHATYFSGLEPEPLADCLEHWLEDLKNGSVTPSSGIKTLTWEESARMLLSRLPLNA